MMRCLGSVKMRSEKAGLVWAAAVVAIVLAPAVIWPATPAERGSAPLLIDGEHLTFEILYGFVPAGQASLEVEGHTTDEGEIYRITSTATSNDVISLFFEVDDRIVADVDASTFEPVYFEKRLSEGPFRKHESVVYQGGGVVRTDGRTYEVEPGTRDILSALYWLRGQDLTVGRDLAVRTFEGGKSYEARVKVLRRESVSTPAGDYDCVVVEPEVREGAFAKTGAIHIWLTDDDRKVPVLMKSKVKVGSFVARLVGLTQGGGAL
jgi:hypothetical protein